MTLALTPPHPFVIPAAPVASISAVRTVALPGPWADALGMVAHPSRSGVARAIDGLLVLASPEESVAPTQDFVRHEGPALARLLASALTQNVSPGDPPAWVAPGAVPLPASALPCVRGMAADCLAQGHALAARDPQSSARSLAAGGVLAALWWAAAHDGVPLGRRIEELTAEGSRRAGARGAR